MCLQKVTTCTKCQDVQTLNILCEAAIDQAASLLRKRIEDCQIFMRKDSEITTDDCENCQRILEELGDALYRAATAKAKEDARLKRSDSISSIFNHTSSAVGKAVKGSKTFVKRSLSKKK